MQAAKVFGAAKPREAILAQRAGVDEKDVLVKEATSDDLKIRLTPEQVKVKRAKEDEIRDMLDQAKAAEEAEDEALASKLRDEAAAQHAELDEMVKGFQEQAVQAAREGKYQSVRQQRVVMDQPMGGRPRLRGRRGRWVRERR